MLHLIEKPHEGVRTRRRWDHATTPFARLLATHTLDPAARERLDRLYTETNPRALRRTIQTGLNTLLYPRPTVVTPARPTVPPAPATPARAVS